VAKKWERMGQGAAAGATLGSVVGPWGTAIGGVVGAGAGLVGGAIEDGNIADEQARQAEELKAQQNKQRQVAFNRFLLGEAAARGANPTAVRARQFEMGAEDMQLQQAQQRKQQQQSFDAYNETDPSAFVGIAQAGARIGQGMYNAYGMPSSQRPSASLQSPAAGSGGGIGGTVNPADLTSIAPPQYTPSKIADPSLSPEVQSMFDAENLRPLRRGRREGF